MQDKHFRFPLSNESTILYSAQIKDIDRKVTKQIQDLDKKFYKKDKLISNLEEIFTYIEQQFSKMDAEMLKSSRRYSGNNQSVQQQNTTEGQ